MLGLDSWLLAIDSWLLAIASRTFFRSNALKSFLLRHKDQIPGVLSGFDRMRFPRMVTTTSARGWRHPLVAADRHRMEGLSRSYAENRMTRMASHNGLASLKQSPTSHGGPGPPRRPTTVTWKPCRRLPATHPSAR